MPPRRTRAGVAELWRRLPGSARLGAAGLLVASLGLAWYLVSFGPGRGGALPRTAPLNLVVITLDTTRADHLGAYGSTDVETPHLDQLAREGVLFEQAMSTAPLTLPAHASMFTGRFPPEHGARDNGGFFLNPEQTTLAEVLKAEGFRTGAFIAAFVLDSKWGLDQGFDTYFDDFDTADRRGGSSASIQRPGNEVVDKALPWIDTVRADPFFAWIHLYDPHTPYDPPEPYKSRYAGHPYRGEVAFTDAQVGRVVEFLRERGLLDRTVIAVLGDHGESLGEHGENAHGFFIYEAATRVPFIIRAPSPAPAGRRVEDPVRVVDLMPTALDLLGIEVPGEISGVSLSPLMTGRVPELGLEGYAEAMYPLHHYGWSDLRALRTGRYKVIDAPRPELYDLARDPGETTNLFAERRALGDRMIARLREKIDEFAHAPVSQPAGDVDPEVRARLAALGYVGSFIASSNEPRGNRADPKDKIGLVNLMAAAKDIPPGPGGFDRRVRILRQVIDEDPDVIAGWFTLGNVHFRERKYREAIGYFRKTLELKPDYDLAVINMAMAYQQIGDDEAALAGFEHYLTIDPKNAYVRYQMGEILLDRGDRAGAEQQFRAALAIDERVAPAKNALGTLAFQRGDLQGAERLIRDAIAIRDDVRLARYNLALIAESRGDRRTAEREYLEELKRHPDSYKAAFNLSRLYEQMGERALQIDALQQAIDGNPGFAEGHILLAKAYLDRGERLQEAVELARKGLSLHPRPELAPLGHYVLADLYSRLGRSADAQREAALGRALETRQRPPGRPGRVEGN
jgi:arylsulfatase A-like enzyme/Tfp pilus assembly protein PilF